MNMIKPNGRLIIKRPIGAPYFDQQPPNHSIQNDALRFDRYDKTDTQPYIWGNGHLLIGWL